MRASSILKEKIYDYIDIIKTDKIPTRGSVLVKENFVMSFRQLLQSYNHDVYKEAASDNSRYSDKDLQCFIDAANTKGNIYNKDICYIESFVDALFVFLLGGAITTIASWACLYPIEVCYEMNRANFKYSSIGVFVVGGVLGGYLSFNALHSNIEQDEFWSDALQCSNSISISELPGASIDVQ